MCTLIMKKCWSAGVSFLVTHIMLIKYLKNGHKLDQKSILNWESAFVKHECAKISQILWINLNFTSKGFLFYSHMVHTSKCKFHLFFFVCVCGCENWLTFVYFIYFVSLFYYSCPNFPLLLSPVLPHPALTVSPHPVVHVHGSFTLVL